MSVPATLARLFSRRAAETNAAPAGPEGFSPLLPEADDTEISPAEASSPEIEEVIGRALMIEYVDSRGARSKRRITVHGCRPQAGDALILAYCHERRAARHFKASRMRSVVDLATGEIFDDAALIVTNFGLLAADAASELKGPTKALFDKYRPGINILLFLARCDSEHPSETQVILNYLDYGADNPDTDWEAVERLIGRLTVDEAAFESSIARLLDRSPDELERVGRFAATLIAADGAVSEAEVTFGEELSAALSLLG